MEKRKIITTSSNNICLYKFDSRGDVEVLLVGNIPTSGFWEFLIGSKEYGYDKDGAEERLLAMLSDAENNENWQTNGYSVTCDASELLHEIEVENEYLLSDEEREVISKFIKTNMS